MNIEKQVVSLDLAKRLKELGVKQEGLFYWTAGGAVYRGEMPFYIETNYVAFTASELGELLPNRISTTEEDEEKKIFSNFVLDITKVTIVRDVKPVSVWRINYICDTTSETRNWLFASYLTSSILDENLSNALAKMLISLIEKGIIAI